VSERPGRITALEALAATILNTTEEQLKTEIEGNEAAPPVSEMQVEPRVDETAYLRDRKFGSSTKRVIERNDRA
jgi:hypothetical protein